MMPANPLRDLPTVNELLESAPLRALITRMNRNRVVTGVRSVLEEIRGEVRDKASQWNLPSLGEMAERIVQQIVATDGSPLGPVVNASGVLLPAGLARPLADAALEELFSAARDYSSAGLDLETGLPTLGAGKLSSLVQQLTAAPSALVVNNHAAAMLLTFSALAPGREVVVARGQVTETGEGERLHELIAASGAILREVGASNTVRLGDYEQAVGENTALLLHVHASDFQLIGASQSVSLEELVSLARRRKLGLLADAGCGPLVEEPGAPSSSEQSVQHLLRLGADVVICSGDGLLGGPSCGLIVGGREHLQRIADHPLLKTVQANPLTLSALAATLRLYQEPEQAKLQVPLLELLATSPDNLKNRAERLAPQIAQQSEIAAAEAVEAPAYLGESRLPSQELPSWGISVTPQSGTAEDLAKVLRCGQPPVLARVEGDRLLLNLRSVPPRHDRALVRAIAALGSGGGEEGEEDEQPSETDDAVAT